MSTLTTKITKVEQGLQKPPKWVDTQKSTDTMVGGMKKKKMSASAFKDEVKKLAQKEMTGTMIKLLARPTTPGQILYIDMYGRVVKTPGARALGIKQDTRV